MSLIKCPECKKKISDKADHCVRCGYPIRRSKKCTLSSEIRNINNTTKEIKETLTKNNESENVSSALFKAIILTVYLLIALSCLILSLKLLYQLIPTSPILFITITILAFISLLSFLIVLIFPNMVKKIKVTEENGKLKNIIFSILRCTPLISLASLGILVICFFISLPGDANSIGIFTLFLYIMMIALIAAMSKDIWYERDRNYILSYIALICTLIIAIMQR